MILQDSNDMNLTTANESNHDSKVYAAKTYNTYSMYIAM